MLPMMKPIRHHLLAASLALVALGPFMCHTYRGQDMSEPIVLTGGWMEFADTPRGREIERRLKAAKPGETVDMGRLIAELPSEEEIIRAEAAAAKGN